jgi:hypothetical protein
LTQTGRCLPPVHVAQYGAVLGGVTRGGQVSLGSSIQAIDYQTGKVVWEHHLEPGQGFLSTFGTSLLTTAGGTACGDPGSLYNQVSSILGGLCPTLIETMYAYFGRMPRLRMADICLGAARNAYRRSGN